MNMEKNCKIQQRILQAYNRTTTIFTLLALTQYKNIHVIIEVKDNGSPTLPGLSASDYPGATVNKSLHILAALVLVALELPLRRRGGACCGGTLSLARNTAKASRPVTTRPMAITRIPQRAEAGVKW